MVNIRAQQRASVCEFRVKGQCQKHTQAHKCTVILNIVHCCHCFLLYVLVFMVMHPLIDINSSFINQHHMKERNHFSMNGASVLTFAKFTHEGQCYYYDYFRLGTYDCSVAGNQFLQ